MTVARDPVIVWGVAPAFGLASPSPFCLKLETWLRMAKIEYETRVLEGPPRSRTKKVPYIERADGSLLPDSSTIIETLATERGLDPYSGVDARGRALATAVTRLVEDSLYFAILYARWMPKDNRAIVRDSYFEGLPGVLRGMITHRLAKSVARACDGQGFGRLSPPERDAKARTDLDALEALFEGSHLLDRPTPVDATVYGALALLLWSPLESEVQRHAKGLENLNRFAETLRDRYWASSPW